MRCYKTLSAAVWFKLVVTVSKTHHGRDVLHSVLFTDACLRFSDIKYGNPLEFRFEDSHCQQTNADLQEQDSKGMLVGEP